VVDRADGTRLVIWLPGEPRPDLSVVDGLARLARAARRAGARLYLEDVAAGLGALLDLAGLSWELKGEPESREDPGRVEEGVDLGNPAP
jgi:hypothetical protein